MLNQIHSYCMRDVKSASIPKSAAFLAVITTSTSNASGSGSKRRDHALPAGTTKSNTSTFFASTAESSSKCNKSTNFGPASGKSSPSDAVTAKNAIDLLIKMLLLIILILLPLACTQQSLYITSSCAFHYHKIGANWVFDRCADPKNTAINFSRDWKVCWILCCGDWSNDRSWSSPALFNECESIKTTVANDRTAMIVGIVVGGTFLFLVLGYVIYKLTSGNERSRVDPQYKLAIIRKNIVRSLVWKSDWGRINESL